jgi:thioredoxin 1
LSELISAVSDDTFEEEVLKSEIPVLVDFWAAWCAPCFMVAPALETLAQDYEGKLKVAKLDVDKNNRTAAEYGIMSIPALLLFKGGEVIETIIGAQPKENIENAMKKYL